MTMVPPMITSLIKFYILHLDPNESLEPPFPTVYVVNDFKPVWTIFNDALCHFRLPFKSHPPFGYLIIWLIDFVAVFFTFACLAPLMSYAAGSSWAIIAFVTDIMNDVTKINRICKVTRQNTWEIKVRFCNIIQLYSEVKQLSDPNISEHFLKIVKFYSFILIQIRQRIQWHWWIFGFWLICICAANNLLHIAGVRFTISWV